MSDSDPARTDPVRGIAEGIDRVFRRLLATVILAGVVVAGILVYVLVSVRPDLQSYRSGLAALNAAHAGMIDQETGLRGYLLTDQTQFLQPYTRGLATVANQDAVLGRALGANPGVAPLLLNMRLAQQAWEQQWAVVAAAGRAPTERTALVSFLNQGKALFDAYRGTEAALGTKINASREALYNQEGWGTGVSLGVIVGLSALLAGNMLRERRRLRGAVVAPVEQIVSATETIARLDLTTEIVPSGPAEFRQIGASINAMREALIEAQDQRYASEQIVQAQATQLRSILSMSREIAGSLNLRYVLRAVSTTAVAVSGFARCVVWLCSDDGKTLSVVFDTLTPSATSDGAPTAEIGIGVVGQAVRYGRTATESDADEPSVEVHPERALRVLSVPLIVGARVIGAIELSASDPHVMTDGSLEVLETLASHAAAAIQSARLHSQTEELAQTDALTGLANRRRLDHELALECERSARHGRPLALIMFDVDHFKRYNDLLGHVRGDEILQELGALISGEIRATDTAYRYGGEEFAVLARETETHEAVLLAERLRARIEEHFAARGSAEPITASFGVGVVPPEQPIPARLIGSADAALYRAKAEGRNRVCTASEAATRGPNQP